MNMTTVIGLAILGVIVFIGGTLHPTNIPYTHLNVVFQSTGIGLLVMAIIIKLSMIIRRKRDENDIVKYMEYKEDTKK